MVDLLAVVTSEIDWHREASQWSGSRMYVAFMACMMAAMDGGDYAGLTMWERVTLRYQAAWGRLEL